MSLVRPSLSWRLAVPFALLSLAGVAATAALAVRTARTALLTATVEHLAHISLDRDEGLRRWIGDKRGEVAFLASDPAFRRSASFPPGSASFLRAGEFLDHMRDSFPDFTAVELLSPATGRAVLSTDPGGIGVDRSGERYFAEGKKGVFVRHPRSTAEGGESPMAVAAPVLSPSGALAGVLVGQVPRARLAEEVREPRGIDGAARVFLVDRAHRRLSFSVRTDAGAPREVRTTAVERALRGETGWGRYRDYRGLPVIGYYRWLPGLNLALVAELDEGDAFAPASHLGFRIAVAGLLVACVVFLLVVAAVRRFVHPIAALTEAVRQVEGGNLDVAVPEGGGDELDALGSAFNRMTANLNRLYGALRESERGYREIFAATSDSLTLHDAVTGAIVDANRGASELFGYGKEELLRRSPADLSARGAEGGGAFLRALDRAVTEGVQRFEWPARHRDGHEVWAEVVLSASGIGGQGRVLASARDITGRKAAEAEIALHRERLEELVRERTGALEEAQDALLEKERFAVLGRLIATVSHELRNPLGTVRNCIFSIGEALRRGEPPAASRSLLLAERNIRRCGAIIDELLDYSRDREAALVPMEVDGFVTHLLDEQTLPEGVGMVRGLSSRCVAALDPVLFRRCLQNVVENALQAMEGSGGKGHVLTVECAGEGEFVEVRVSDTGPGIPPELRAKVFEPLFSTKPTGVGLGLPLVKDVMEKHHGGVELRDAPGGGATVVLRLPRVAPAE